MTQPSIGDFGLLGDTRTAALVDGRGRIAWLCLPHFDGDPVFGSLLAGDGGGEFSFGPVGEAAVISRRYRAGSAVLETTWRVGDAGLVLTEGMVADVVGTLLPTTCLVRRLEARGGAVACRMRFDPRFGDGRRRPAVRATPAVLVCAHGGVALSLTVDGDVAVQPGRDARSRSSRVGR